MSDGLKLFVVILMLPFLAAVGHDVYLNYFSNVPPGSDFSEFDVEDIKVDIKNLDIKSGSFKTSELGWVWQHYSPNSLRSVNLLIDETVWDTLIDPLLKMKTIIVGLLPALFGLFILALFYGSRLPMWVKTKSAQKRAHIDYAVYNHAKGKKFQYKRK